MNNIVNFSKYEGDGYEFFTRHLKDYLRNLECNRDLIWFDWKYSSNFFNSMLKRIALYNQFDNC
jgi:hypothetical protein